jgi:lipopolysaccharide/colanic/teichoic acid biosynthesis glycosyltransferase
MGLRVKRLIDVIAASVGLLLLSPLLGLIAAAVVLCLGGPVLFRQQRSGYLTRPFTLLKFRTMREAVGPDGRLLPDAERLSRLGRFLRRTSLDELPQLWNVLCGDMSLVGPRPLLMEYLPYYSPEQQRRHQVRPGVTGWAQVHGRNLLEWEEQFRYDVWYVDHSSVWLDLRILALTVLKVFKAEGTSPLGKTTRDLFRGVAPPEAPQV